MPRRSYRSAAILALAAGLLSCDDEGTAPDLEPCTQSVAITVGKGTRPAFTWTPACALGGLEILGPMGHIAWNVVGLDAPLIRPGIRYGAAPRGAIVTDGPLPIVVGEMHFVRQRIWVAPGVLSVSPTGEGFVP